MKDLPFGRINESRQYIKKLGYELRPEFTYALNLCPWHLRQNKRYEGLFYLFYDHSRIIVDCNSDIGYRGVRIPNIVGDKGDTISEIGKVKKFFAEKVVEYITDQNKGNQKPKILSYEEVESMGLIEDLKKKHAEEKPGRNLWNPQIGEIRVFKVQELRDVETKVGTSPMFDVVDVDTKEELSVWGYARLMHVFEPDGIYVVEYNGKNEMATGLEAHSFWVTDVTKEYQEGIKKGKK